MVQEVAGQHKLIQELMVEYTVKLMSAAFREASDSEPSILTSRQARKTGERGSLPRAVVMKALVSRPDFRNSLASACPSGANVDLGQSSGFRSPVPSRSPLRFGIDGIHGGLRCHGDA
jgi:hypothetical protein